MKKRTFRPKQTTKLSELQLGVKPVRGSWDVGTTSDDNKNHWAHVEALSADAAASPSRRKIIRERARYEYENNTYCGGIVETFVSDVIGPGPRLQMVTGDSMTNARIELAFHEWMKRTSLSKKLQTFFRSSVIDGECFFQFITNRGLPGRVLLDLILLETEQVADPTINMVGTSSTDGIILDHFGNPISYSVLKNHPGGAVSSFVNGATDVPADQIIHLFRQIRPGQHRAVSEIVATLPLFAQLRRFTLAVLAAAETAAEVAGVLHSQSAPDEGPDEVPPMDEIEIVKRMLLTLPAGWKIDQIKAEQPSTTYVDFKHEIINEAARILSMPFNIAAANSKDYNYASGRLDHQTYFRNVEIRQSQLDLDVMDVILSTWWQEAELLADVIPPQLRGGPTLHRWFWKKPGHVDPMKEAGAEDLKLTNKTLSYADAFAARSLDWEEQFTQIAKEQAAMRELGISPTEIAPVIEEVEEDEA